VRISEYLGMSDILFGFLLAAVAIAAFVATWYVENRVNRRENVLHPLLRNRYAVAVAALFLLLAVVAFLPGRDDIINLRIAEAKRQQTCVFKEIPADKLANEIINNYYGYNIIDVRPAEEYEKFHIPMAINIPLDRMMERQNEALFRQKLRTNVFYADNDTVVRMACLKAKFVGKSENLILRESAAEFRALFFEPEVPATGSAKQTVDQYNFRTQAARKMEEMVATLKSREAPVKREVVSVRGGC